MFKGWGKFSLLLAGAALLVVSCGQGPAPKEVAAPKAAPRAVPPIEDVFDVFLDYQATQALIQKVRRDPAIKMAEQALSRSRRSLEWGSAVAVHFNDPSARSLMVYAGSDVVLFVTAEQKPLGTSVQSALLVSLLQESGNTRRVAMSELTGGLVVHQTVSKSFGGSASIDDWGPRQGTQTLSELTAIGPQATHHPEIPPTEPCQGPQGTRKNCDDEEEALKKAVKALGLARNGALSGTLGVAKETATSVGAGAVINLGGSRLCTYNGDSSYLGPYCEDVVNVSSGVAAAAGTSKAFVDAAPKFTTLNEAKAAVKAAQKALDDCRGPDDPPPGDYCPIPNPSPDDLRPTVPYMPENWYGSTGAGIDWGALAVVTGGVLLIGAAVVFSGGTAGAALGAAAAAGIIGPVIVPPGFLPFQDPPELSDSLGPSDLFIAPALPSLEIMSRDPAPLVFE